MGSTRPSGSRGLRGIMRRPKSVGQRPFSAIISSASPPPRVRSPRVIPAVHFARVVSTVLRANACSCAGGGCQPHGAPVYTDDLNIIALTNQLNKIERMRSKSRGHGRGSSRSGGRPASNDDEEMAKRAGGKRGGAVGGRSSGDANRWKSRGTGRRNVRSASDSSPEAVGTSNSKSWGKQKFDDRKDGQALERGDKYITNVGKGRDARQQQQQQHKLSQANRAASAKSKSRKKDGGIKLNGGGGRPGEDGGLMKGYPISTPIPSNGKSHSDHGAKGGGNNGKGSIPLSNKKQEQVHNARKKSSSPEVTQGVGNSKMRKGGDKRRGSRRDSFRDLESDGEDQMRESRNKGGSRRTSKIEIDQMGNSKHSKQMGGQSGGRSYDAHISSRDSRHGSFANIQLDHAGKNSKSKHEERVGRHSHLQDLVRGSGSSLDARYSTSTTHGHRDGGGGSTLGSSLDAYSGGSSKSGQEYHGWVRSSHSNLHDDTGHSKSRHGYKHSDDSRRTSSPYVEHGENSKSKHGHTHPSSRRASSPDADPTRGSKLNHGHTHLNPRRASSPDVAHDRSSKLNHGHAHLNPRRASSPDVAHDRSSKLNHGHVHSNSRRASSPDVAHEKSSKLNHGQIHPSSRRASSPDAVPTRGSKLNHGHAHSNSRRASSPDYGIHEQNHGGAPPSPSSSHIHGANHLKSEHAHSKMKSQYEQHKDLNSRVDSSSAIDETGQLKSKHRGDFRRGSLQDIEREGSLKSKKKHDGKTNAGDSSQHGRFPNVPRHPKQPGKNPEASTKKDDSSEEVNPADSYEPGNREKNRKGELRREGSSADGDRFRKPHGDKRIADAKRHGSSSSPQEGNSKSNRPLKHTRDERGVVGEPDSDEAATDKATKADKALKPSHSRRRLKSRSLLSTVDLDVKESISSASLAHHHHSHRVQRTKTTRSGNKRSSQLPEDEDSLQDMKTSSSLTSLRRLPRTKRTRADQRRRWSGEYYEDTNEGKGGKRKVERDGDRRNSLDSQDEDSLGSDVSETDKQRPPSSLLAQGGDTDTSPLPPTPKSSVITWDMSIRFKTPLKAPALPFPENLLAHIDLKYPDFEWPKGIPCSLKSYPCGPPFSVVYENGGGRVYYPHGCVAILISAPTNLPGRVLVIRDPFDQFYFFDKAVLADLSCDGTGRIYDESGEIIMEYNSQGGYRLDKNYTVAIRWKWTKGGQRMVIKLNRYMSLKIMEVSKVFLVFYGNKRGVRLNVGAGRRVNLMSAGCSPDTASMLAELEWKSFKLGDGGSFDFARGRCNTPTPSNFNTEPRTRSRSRGQISQISEQDELGSIKQLNENDIIEDAFVHYF